MIDHPAPSLSDAQPAHAECAAATSPRNRILSVLAEEDLDRLMPHLEPITLKHGQVLHTPGRRIEHVYFIEHGLVSTVADSHRTKPVEVWMIGREGLAGTPVLLGVQVSTHRRLVVVPGSALRIESSELQDAFDESSTLRQVLLRYVHAVLKQTSITGACNARHTLQQRLARWLLIARDLLESDDLPLTHQTLSLMLAVRRAGVTETLAALESQGVVEHRRGHVVICDLQRLQRASCSCYTGLQTIYDRWFTPNGMILPE